MTNNNYFCKQIEIFRNIKTFIVGLCLHKNEKKLSNYFDNDRATLHTVYTYYI